jgi:hypothetical protein
MAAYFCTTGNESFLSLATKCFLYLFCLNFIGILPYFQNYDYIILNCGHHAAAHSHYGFQLYQKTVSRMINAIETDRLLNNKKYFWIESVAIPLHQDDGVIKFKDWRTYHRLHLYNALAEEVIRKSNLSIAIIPAYQSTMSLFDKVQ